MAVTACGGSGVDKAGGAARGESVVLTMAARDPFDHQEFVRAVERLSNGSIEIEVKPPPSEGSVDYEQTVADVRAGRVDLALIPAAAWDTLGVTSFQALVAPFLVDSLALQRRVLESRLAPRMLRGVEPLGLVGLAVLPGPLRRPLGVTRALLGPEDYAGATIGIARSAVAESTFRSLGATPKGFDFGPGYDPGAIAGLDGLELDLRMVFNQGYLTNGAVAALTANVVFWPMAETISMNREAFDALTVRQRSILRRGGRKAIAADADRIATWYESEPLVSGCRPSMLTFAPAAQADVAALREAVRPVYSELERDPVTREMIAEIRKIRHEVPASGVLRCPSESLRVDTSTSELDGLWRATLSREELVAAGASSQDADECNCSYITLEIENGRWVDSLGGKSFATGTFTVEGNRMRVRGLTCSPDPCAPFTEEYTWSRYRDTLSFARVPGRPFTAVMTADSFKRVR